MRLPRRTRAELLGVFGLVLERRPYLDDDAFDRMELLQKRLLSSVVVGERQESETASLFHGHFHGGEGAEEGAKSVFHDYRYTKRFAER